jgi:hypothetical protein
MPVYTAQLLDLICTESVILPLDIQSSETGKRKIECKKIVTRTLQYCEHITAVVNEAKNRRRCISIRSPSTSTRFCVLNKKTLSDYVSSAFAV